MVVAKTVNPAPRGSPSGMQQPSPLGLNGLDYLDPEDQDDEDIDPDDVEVTLADPLGDEESENDPPPGFDDNLAETLLDGSTITSLCADLYTEFDEDLRSRRDWVTTYTEGLDLLGLSIEDRTEPWPGACGVYHPVLAEALVKFQAETMGETFPAQGPVRTQIIGRETPEKRDASKRVEADMNFQLTEKMTEYRPEHERMLWGLGLSGNAFKKVYFDPSLNRQTAVFVPAEDVVVPYGASNLETAERVTHVMRKTKNEMAKLVANGFYRDCNLSDPINTMDETEKAIAEKMGFQPINDERYKLLEMQVDLIIDDDPFREDTDDNVGLPYIVTLEKGTQEVLSIRRNWYDDDPLKAKRSHFVHYSYVPGFGFYAFGLIHLVGAFAKSGTSLLRQLVDAGTLSNLPGGFKTKGLRVKGDDTPISPAEWRDVDVPSGTMRDNIMPLPYKEPSAVLFQLLQNIVDEGRKFAGAADMKLSDMSAQAPVGTTLAILERMLKLMSAVQARVHFAMKREFQLLKAIIRDYTPDEYTYDPEDGVRHAKKADYDAVDILPVSDPNAATMAQKIVQYQAVLQLAASAPQIYDMPYLHRQMLEVLGIKNASKLVPMADDDSILPVDPVSENMNIINGKPVKAFIYQDHDAHIAVHTSAVKDPQIQQYVGQNPSAPIIMGAMSAHVMEHLAFAYRKQIEDQAGVPLPPPDAPMDEDTELAVSRLAAAAAQQVLQNKQAQAQNQQNQQASQDPIVQQAQQELALKGREVAVKEGELTLKQQIAKVDALAKADQSELEYQRIESQKQIAGMNAGLKGASDKAKLDAQGEQFGLTTGLGIAKDAIGGASAPPDTPPATPPDKDTST
jgi:hypothetical protein